MHIRKYIPFPPSDITAYTYSTSASVIHHLDTKIIWFETGYTLL